MKINTSSILSYFTIIFFSVSAMIPISFGQPQTMELFTKSWYFNFGDVRNGQDPLYDDSNWKLINLPHDWSIEGLAQSITKKEEAPEFNIVKGEWKFNQGDNLDWKNPDRDDSSWQIVNLPSTWEQHSNYTQDNVFGWFRRELHIPAELSGKDIYINLGKIDDIDETYFNGVKVGSMGSFPPNYVTAWDAIRRYKVPHEIIHYGGKNLIAVRVFDGIMGGGIYDEGVKMTEGPFESTCPGGSGAGYINAGIGWYRKMFGLPESIRGKRIFIEFDGVYMNSDVWINGIHLGNRPYGYSSFQYELTPHLKFGEEKNVLAVRVNVQQPCSRWYSGAGIYRNVRLKVTDPVHIAHWGTYVTTPVVSESEAIIRIETKIHNQSNSSQIVKLESIITDDEGHKCGSISSTQEVEVDSICTFKQSIKLSKPKLWTLENPFLYHVKSKVYVNGKIVDTYDTPFGIRTFEFTIDKGFFLNGKHVPIKGVCLHHDLGCLGSAVNKRAIERQLEIMKSMGCNAIRTSHNPPAPELLDLCDRMGFLVMDEAFDEWKKSKTMYGYGRFFDEWSERDLRDMIRRDRNHPSIILWSIGNEIPEQDNANAYEMAKRLADICREEDPTRPITSACNNPGIAVESGFAKPLDVLGINYNIQFYQTLKGKAKLIASETASTVSTRGEYNLVQDGDTLKIVKELNNQCTSYDITVPNWANRAETVLKAIKNSPWVAGEFVWTGFDYIGEPTPFGWPSVSSYFGIVDRCGFQKDRYYLYQSQWTDNPMVHILPHWNWQGFEGKEIPVWCYSNCESVELFLNGKSLGEKKFSDTDDLHLEWKVPYVPGTLRAVAKNKGKVVCTDEVQTAGAPAKILLSPDRTEISADGKDLSFIKVAIVDREGRVCPNADNLVKFKIQGKGIIAGVDNGNPVSHEYFKTSERKAFHGLCLVVVQSMAEKGTIHLSAESEGLQSAEVLIHVK
ncbi:glycoside hydrolase family 2 TIM barrel-domain containing protein [Melioribacter sp. OK-6-Me]|uniref:glycoside hydrolase family 2 TIM barrel-domain containing protein n=1 Tax=unclassified Melioribacter TaxID=2627329 RepID=UPI003EDA4D63